MNVAELRVKSVDELRAELFNLSKEQFSLRMQKATGQQVKSSQIKLVRRDIARINMVLGELKRAAK